MDDSLNERPADSQADVDCTVRYLTWDDARTKAWIEDVARLAVDAYAARANPDECKPNEGAGPPARDMLPP